MQRFDVVVIGAGISGLSCAHAFAASGRRVAVLEAGKSIGGAFATRRFPEQQGFWLELGCHTLYNSYRTLIGALQGSALHALIQPRKKAPYYFYRDGGLEGMMKNFSVGEALLNGWRLFREKKEGASVEAYYSSVFGKNNYRRILRPAFGAVISQDPDRFPAEVLLKCRPRDKRLPRSFTGIQGVSSIAEALAGHDNIELFLGAEVSALRKADKEWIVTAPGEELSGTQLVLAVQPRVAARLLTQEEPQLAQLLSKIPSARVESVGVVLPREAVGLPEFSFLIPGDGAPFSSVVSRDVVPSAGYRGFAFHFRDGTLKREERLDAVVRALKIRQSDIAAVAERTHELPALEVGHQALALDIRTACRRNRSLGLAGNYFGGLAVEDCLLRSAEVVAELAG